MTDYSKYDSLIQHPGLALDVDETLCWTIGYWVKHLQKEFGNPENLTVEELISKYRYAQNVPYWQTPQALKWMEDTRKSNEIKRILPLIKDSNTYVNKINKIIPIAAYITIRHESTIDATKYWLSKHDFPDAPIICKPDSVDMMSQGNLWKAKVLEQLYPKILGIVDDNVSVLKNLSENYKGTIFLYDHSSVNSKLNAIACKDWKSVYEEVKKKFHQ